MKEVKSGRIDWSVFIATFFLIVAICLPLVLFPEKGAVIVNQANDFFTTNLGLLFCGVAQGVLAF